MNFVIEWLILCFTAAAVNGRANTRIANRGETASEGEFPYQVSIKIGRQHHCGGSLISKQHVLTAAHCVHPFVQMGRVPEPMTVEVGSTIIDRGTFHGVTRMSYFREYQGETRTKVVPKDIAVIHLAKPVELSGTVRTIKLPDPYTTPAAGTPVILSGFGKSDVRGETSPILKKMEATITDKEVCRAYYKDHTRRELTDDKVCAAKEADYGACQGDSGGPLVNMERSTVYGVVSAGDGQCSNGQPDTYTDVSKFIPYINEELNYDPNNPQSGSHHPAITLDGSTDLSHSQSHGGRPPIPQNPHQQQLFHHLNRYPQHNHQIPNPHYPQGIPGSPSQFQNPFGHQHQMQGFLGPGHQPNPFNPNMFPGGLPQGFPGFGKKR